MWDLTIYSTFNLSLFLNRSNACFPPWDKDLLIGWVLTGFKGVVYPKNQNGNFSRCTSTESLISQNLDSKLTVKIILMNESIPSACHIWWALCMCVDLNWNELLDSYGLYMNCLQHYELLGASKFSKKSKFFIKIISKIKKRNNALTLT